MIVIRSILFERDELRVFAQAALAAPLAYPERTADDPRPGLLGAFARNAWEPITYPRLVLAREVCAEILAVTAREHDPEHWRALAPDGEPTATEASMSAVLVEARTAQQAEVEAATVLVETALAELSERDNPRAYADERFQV